MSQRVPFSTVESRPGDGAAADSIRPRTLDGDARSVPGEPAEERPFLSVVIPAYNEAESVDPTVGTVADVVDEVCSSYEIIVVDDGSDDDTPDELRSVAGESPPVRCIRNEVNRGKGHAIRDGCRAALGEYVLLLDADGDLASERIATFLARMEETDADVVIGSKRHPDSDVTYPLQRRLLSKGYSALIRLLFGLQVTDTQVGMKLLHRDVVDDVMPLLLVERYAFDVELLALAHQYGYGIAEAPVSIDFNGDSRIDWRAVCRIGWDTLAVCSRLRLLGSYEKLERAVSYVREHEPPVETATDGRGDG